mmetsp:Transcript_15398/g.47888  ORF Transcript_15398/g.47888 Transcript_15398/m.47888 type:complete len:224 (+) Transcript_15398:2211-2882(+)
MMVQPTDQISELELQPDISITSGAIQYGEPTTECTFLSPSVSFVATPKSASLAVPSLVTRVLAALMSLCSTPCSCRYTRPSSTCAIYMAARLSGSAPNLDGLMAVESAPPSTNSRMMYRWLRVLNEPRYVTTFLCRSILSRSISSMMVLSSSLGMFSSDTCLMATMSPFCRSTPLNTRPYAPLPISSPSRYFSFSVRRPLRDMPPYARARRPQESAPRAGHTL